MERSEAWELTDRLHAPTGKGDPFAAAVRATRMPMLVTDPRQPDNPIVFANDAFLRLTGYGRSEVMGRNCRFLQGPQTDLQAIQRLKTAIASGQDIAIDILNYRKDGTPFWNALYISPVVDEKNGLLFFFASQVDLTARKQAELSIIEDRARIEGAVAERTRELEAALAAQTELLHELDHRVKNNLQVISALILLEARTADGRCASETLNSIKERVGALANVHRGLYRDGNIGRFDAGAFIREFIAEALSARGSCATGLELDLTEAPIAASYAAPVALIASELVRIGIAYREQTGQRRLRFAIRKIEGKRYRFCLEVDQPLSVLDNCISASSRDFIAMLAKQLRTSVHWPSQDLGGSSICVDLPIDETERGT